MTLWMNQNGHAGGDPNAFLRLQATLDGDIDDSMRLGPNREVNHGTINLSLIDAEQGQPYDRQQVVSKYCHVATQEDGVTPLWPPTPGEVVDISTQIAQVGSWNSNEAWLSRGYFTCANTAIMLIVRATGELVRIWPGVLTYWPSVTGPHLHFEVRSPGKVGVPDANHRAGEMNPHHWIGLAFGGRK